MAIKEQLLKRSVVCGDCGIIDAPRKAGKTNPVLIFFCFAFVALAFVIAALDLNIIYVVIGAILLIGGLIGLSIGHSHNECRECGSRNVFPCMSPKGKQLMSKMKQV